MALASNIQDESNGEQMRVNNGMSRSTMARARNKQGGTSNGDEGCWLKSPKRGGRRCACRPRATHPGNESSQWQEQQEAC